MIANLLCLLPLLASVSAVPHRRAPAKHITWEGKCLAVETLKDGAFAEVVDCNNGWHNKWEIAAGNNPNGVRLAGTNFCLDAGEGAHSEADAKIWTCYKGLFQQTWWYTDDKHLAVTGGSVCLDSCDGPVQTFRCEGDSPNQVFGIVDAGGSTDPEPSASSSSSAPGPSTTSSSSAPGPSSTPPVRGGQFEWKNKCIVVDGKAAKGTLLAIDNCATKGTKANQLFTVARNTPGPIRLASNPNLCVDADVGGATTNGNVIKLWDCLDVPQQQWYYTDDDHLAVLGGNTCIDVKDGRSALQTWQCYGGNTNQMFSLH